MYKKTMPSLCIAALEQGLVYHKRPIKLDDFQIFGHKGLEIGFLYRNPEEFWTLLHGNPAFVQKTVTGPDPPKGKRKK